MVSAEQLLEKAWDEHIDPFTNVVRVTMMKLRRKLGDPPVVETVAGRGVPDPMKRQLTMRTTIRARLTLVYGGLFLLAGMVLLGRHVRAGRATDAADDRVALSKSGGAHRRPTAAQDWARWAERRGHADIRAEGTGATWSRARWTRC